MSFSDHTTVYIYEYIRTRGYEPLHFEKHFRHLEELSHQYALFPLGKTITREKVRAQIAEKLKKAGYAPTATNAVCVIVPAFSEPKIEIEEIFYDSFALRALHHQGFRYNVSNGLVSGNTSVRMAILNFNRLKAQIADEGVAVWINEKREVLAVDGASVIAVFEDEIRFSSHGNGVEFEMAYEKVSAARKNVTRGTIYEEDLLRAKEILGIDYRGIVALYSFEEHRYMDIIAEKIAEIMSEAK